MEKTSAKLLLAALFVLIGWGALWGQFDGGYGTVYSPWQVATAAQLDYVRNYLGTINSNKYFIQTADIDLGVAPWNEGNGWLPIGFTVEDPHAEYPFSGNYNGGGHTISGLYINRPNSGESGLFGFTQEAHIINLNLMAVQAYASGSLVGYAKDTIISYCHSSGTVSGNIYAGGLVGDAFRASMHSCSFSGTVSASNFAGGLVGTHRSSALSDSYSTASVSAGICAGGLVGTSGSSTIRNSYYDYESVLVNGGHYITIGALGSFLYNTWMANARTLMISHYLSSDGLDYLLGSVADLQYLLAFGQFGEYSYRLTADLDLQGHPGFYIPLLAGDFDGDGHQISGLNVTVPDGISGVGLFGRAMGSTIRDLRLTNVNVHGYAWVGGLVGSCQDVEIAHCHFIGNVSGHSSVGALIGDCIDSEISDCSSAGSVAGSLIHTGGLIGVTSNTQIIRGCSSAWVQGYQRVGGLMGFISQSMISDSYSTGHAIGTNEVGGLTGGNSDGSIWGCYSSAVVQGTYNAGGLVGRYVYYSVTVVGSYWDMQRSGQSLSAGGSGRTTAEMTAPYAANTYVDWDFYDVWVEDYGYLNGGYPVLQSVGYVEAEDELLVPATALSLRNYPNPFNPSTTIEFNLPTPEEVQLSIYNLKGQRIRQFSSAFYPSGRHSIVWDGRDDHGKKAASGTYLCRLMSAAQAVTRKLLILK